MKLETRYPFLPQIYIIMKSDFDLSNEGLESDIPGNSEDETQFINRTVNDLSDQVNQVTRIEMATIDRNKTDYPLAYIHYTIKL